VSSARLGILGGTFDPIHVGHLILAEETRLRLALDRVIFMPAAQPWRKADRQVAPAADRLAMVLLAIEGNPHFTPSEIELRRDGPTYTAETLAQVRAEIGPEPELWFILGADALLDLPYWEAPDTILQHARLAVTDRGALLPDNLERLELRLPGLGARLDLIQMPRVDVSSTELRRRLRDGISTRYWLPPGVERYAVEHRLYRA
jgi:nicotinate-nucleotide adenylyltransferase